MTTEPTVTRPLPPPLEFPYPPCSICGKDTSFDDGFYCSNCDASWPSEGAPEGEWGEPKAEQCPSTHRPYPADPNERLAAIEYRCVLDAGHADRDVEMHQHPQSWDGWKDSEAAR